MNAILSIDELDGTRKGLGLLRLPPGVDVPLSARVRRLLDSASMRRLAQVSQLGLVHLVYPGATHSRLEHSLGVYRTALEFLRRLALDPRFLAAVTRQDAESFLAASLLHDIGHWPYCHPIEDLQLPGVMRHEELARQRVTEGELGELLIRDWGLDPSRVADAIVGKPTSRGEKITASMLSGPIDVDKIDYLARDSHHAGVPYGNHFDASRLMSSLCLNKAGTAVAVTDKGRTAAELMVFARYVMFSEVYWHHTVRAATAMLQRAMTMESRTIDWHAFYAATDLEMPNLLRGAMTDGPSRELIEGLVGPQRRLYKRMAQYSLTESPQIYRKIARQSYQWLIDLGERIAQAIRDRTGLDIASHEILVDAPPQKLEVQANIEVYYTRSNEFRPLAEVSPVVEALAQRQFDDYVKRVRVFCHPRWKGPLEGIAVDEIMATALSSEC